MLYFHFQQPFCGYRAQQGHCRGACSRWAEPVYFRKDVSCANTSTELSKNSSLFKKTQKAREGNRGTCYQDHSLLLGPAEVLSSPRNKIFLTFNDSPRCFPAQDSFSVHLVLLVTAHYCKGHAFLLGRDTWRDLSNLFQRAAPSLFPIHLLQKTESTCLQSTGCRRPYYL